MSTVKRNDPCICGSGLKYKKCHLNKPHNHLQNDIDKAPEDKRMVLEERFFKQKSKIEQCLHPLKENCSEIIVSAHSIQKNSVLSAIADKKGRVITFGAKPTEYGLNFSSKKVIKKFASTFSGFCSIHDKKTFAPIEDRNFIGSDQQTFLFAYRACAFELHSIQESYFINYNIAQKYKNEETLKNEAFDLYKGMESMKTALESLRNYKEKLDASLIEEKYDLLDTVKFEIENDIHIAVSSGVFLEFDVNGNQINDLKTKNPSDLKLLIVNVMRKENKNIALISYLKEDKGYFSSYIKQIGELNSTDFYFYMNNLLTRYCTRNLFLSPELWDSMNKFEKEKLLKSVSLSGLFSTKNLLKDPGFNLFKSM